jgi:hypothetical protein
MIMIEGEVKVAATLAPYMRIEMGRSGLILGYGY